jgi:hypothetical protein
MSTNVRRPHSDILRCLYLHRSIPSLRLDCTGQFKIKLEHRRSALLVRLPREAIDFSHRRLSSGLSETVTQTETPWSARKRGRNKMRAPKYDYSARTPRAVGFERDCADFRHGDLKKAGLQEMRENHSHSINNHGRASFKLAIPCCALKSANETGNGFTYNRVGRNAKARP